MESVPKSGLEGAAESALLQALWVRRDAAGTRLCSLGLSHVGGQEGALQGRGRVLLWTRAWGSEGLVLLEPKGVKEAALDAVPMGFACKSSWLPGCPGRVLLRSSQHLGPQRGQLVGMECSTGHGGCHLPETGHR